MLGCYTCIFLIVGRNGQSSFPEPARGSDRVRFCSVEQAVTNVESSTICTLYTGTLKYSLTGF